jgi:DNA-binding response OmpR family regulator
MPKKILVVDDDPDILDALVMILESKGYEITRAHDGVEAIERLVAEKPDLMVLDLLMPKMDGFRVFKKLQEPSWSEFSTMPILILTSVREEASRRRYELETGKELNADDYLEKPFSPDILLSKVTNLLK